MDGRPCQRPIGNRNPIEYLDDSVTIDFQSAHPKFCCSTFQLIFFQGIYETFLSINVSMLRAIFRVTSFSQFVFNWRWWTQVFCFWHGSRLEISHLQCVNLIVFDFAHICRGELGWSASSWAWLITVTVDRVRCLQKLFWLVCTVLRSTGCKRHGAMSGNTTRPTTGNHEVFTVSRHLGI